MDYRMGFSDSNEISNGSSICCVATAAATNAETLSSSDHPSPPPDICALRRLSQNLESLFSDSSSERFADAKILVGTEQVAVHRCLLVARSPFFKNAFSNSKEAELKLKDLAKDHEVGLDALLAVLTYLYSGKVRPLPKGVCVCVDDDCSHEACRPAVDFMVQVLYASFTFQVSELVALYQVILFLLCLLNY